MENRSIQLASKVNIGPKLVYDMLFFLTNHERPCTIFIIFNAKFIVFKCKNHRFGTTWCSGKKARAISALSEGEEEKETAARLIFFGQNRP